MKPAGCLDMRIENGAWEDISALESQAQKCFETVMDHKIKGVQPGLVAVLLTDDAEVRRLNKTYRSIDKPTNVLSFPADFPAGPDELPPLGDIVMAYETCCTEATAKGVSVLDHFSHLLVHGLLHLFGYDHMEAEEALEMEALEVQLLSKIGVADPYSD